MTQMTWIKICGITTLEDAQAAVDAGADALGFVFYEKSPRKVDADTVREIISKLPAEIEKVGIFVDQPASAANTIVEQAGLTCVQIYGYDDAINRGDFAITPSTTPGKVILALSGKSLENGFLITKDFAEKVFAVLVDSGRAGAPGGTGVRFDWEKTKGMIRGLGSHVPVIVAGGLNPANVSEAMRTLHPWGVDVSSGVESRPGKKDLTKIRAFIDAVRDADRLQ